MKKLYLLFVFLLLPLDCFSSQQAITQVPQPVDGKFGTYRIGQNINNANAQSNFVELFSGLASKQNALGFTPENAASKGVANGYAGLGADAKVPLAQLPDNIGGTDITELINDTGAADNDLWSAAKITSELASKQAIKGADDNYVTDAEKIKLTAANRAAFIIAWGWDPGDNLGSATAANVASLFPGTGACLKSDGTRGDCGTGGGIESWADVQAVLTGGGTWVRADGTTGDPIGEVVDFSVTAPIGYLNGNFYLIPWANQAAFEDFLGWSFSGSGGGITVSSTLPTTAGSATLNDSTHVLTVASDTGYTQFTGSFTAWDYDPAPFGFGTIPNAVAGQQYCWTTPVTVADINRPATVASTATSYKINGSTSTATTISIGNTITPCMIASTTPGATVTGNLTLGGVAGSPVFSVTTAAAPIGSYDNFTGTDNTALATHDANWGNLNTRLVANCKLIDNSLVPSTTYGTCGARYTTSTSDISEAVLVAQAAAGSAKKVHVRTSGSSFGYDASLGAVSGGNTTTVGISKNNTFLDSCSFTAAWNTDRTLRVVASGTSPVIITVYVNGAQVCQKTDETSPIASGNPGVSIVGDGSYTDAKIDTWKDN